MQYDNDKKLKEYNDIHRQISDIYHEIAAKLKLSVSAFTVFYTICDMGGTCSQKDICDLFYTSKQTINSCIKKLEKENYIYLKQGKGKDKNIYLTEKGEQIVTQKIAPILNIEQSIFSEMTEQECDMLLQLSRKYLHCFKQKLNEMT
ncbi:MAG: winged helix-turn-helix transcriptional regulator [Firmicutes bacterium]|jgi:DNA-binding MarR family transcriptional regulator|nr:winged helix-turn-helix transcriptional regulator [Bacillota bacterium]